MEKNHNPNLTPAGESARCETGGSLNFTLLGWQSRLAHCIVLNCTKGSFSNLGSSTKDVHQNTGKIDTLLLSALVHNLSPSCRRPQTWLNTRWTVTHGHPVITRCLWVTAVGTGRTQCWLQAVSGWYLSIYLLPIPRTPRSTCCELQFIQLVTCHYFSH